jgi:hypothetical protein
MTCDEITWSRFFLPKSLNTIRGMGMNYGKTIRQKIAAEVVDLKQQGKRFGITVDKWTSIKKSSLLKFKYPFTELFLEFGTCRAESWLELVDKRLKEYGFNINDGDDN